MRRVCLFFTLLSPLEEFVVLFADSIPELWREVPGVRIPGGSEDVLLDLAVRQLVKNYQAQTKKLEKESKL